MTFVHIILFVRKGNNRLRDNNKCPKYTLCVDQIGSQSFHSRENIE